jgi:hypothetical protein
VGSEVIVPRLGELRSRDLVAAYGNALAGMQHVDVLVLAAEGPVAARVELGRLASGPSVHTGLVCQGCQRVVLLLVVRDRELRCRACLKLRTNRQRERTTAAWRRRGGREADRLLRLVASPTLHLTRGRLAEARDLVKKIVEADVARVAALKGELEALQHGEATS